MKKAKARHRNQSRNKAQKTYASFCDANQDVLLETYIAKRDELENEIKTKYGFRIVDHSVKFYGYCKQCQEVLDE